MRFIQKYLAFGMALTLACMLESCFDSSSNSQPMVTTHSYGVDLTDIKDYDSVTVDIIWGGDTKTHSVYTEQDEESDHKIRWDIVAPETEVVNINTIVWWEGDSVYAQHGVYTSGQTPVIPDPEIASPAGVIRTFTDSRDGAKYKYRRIGTQIWMLQNLNYSGDDGNGQRTYSKGWCYGVGGTDTTNHEDANTCNIYGRLYNWTDAMDINRFYLVNSWKSFDTINHQGICPADWHVPTKNEWQELVDFVDIANDGVNNDNEANSLKAGEGAWSIGVISDDYSFSVLPAAFRDSLGSWDYPLGVFTAFLTASEYFWDIVWLPGFYNIQPMTEMAYDLKYGGFSLRCVKNPKNSEENRSSMGNLSSSSPVIFDTSAFIDNRDQQSYSIVQIGTQKWMGENLNYIPVSGTSWCYGNLNSNCDKYGRLYSYESAQNSCPIGWKLPSANDWDSLIAFVGGASIAGQKLKSTTDWDSSNPLYKPGFDSYGFRALPAGINNLGSGGFLALGKSALWWTSSSATRSISLTEDNVSLGGGGLKNGLSVRCLQQL